MKRPDAWQSNQGNGYTAKEPYVHYSTERRNVTRERMDVLLNLVVECRKIEDINVNFEVDKYGEYITVWTSKPEDGISMTIYKSGKFSTGYINKDIQAITDPALVMAEVHLRRLLNG